MILYNNANTADKKTEKVFARWLPMTETAFYMLLALTKPRHGYGIVKSTKILTDKRLIIGSGTIYGTINKMLKDGLIEIYDKIEDSTIYFITDLGREILDLEIKRIGFMQKDIDAVMSGNHPEDADND